MTLDELKRLIEESVPESTAYLFDPQMDGQHLEAIVVSPCFKGIPLVKQHQMVMKPLREALAGDVHALALKTLTPEQWQERQQSS